ncbi:MAG: hypothetical protein U0694_17640 [Anaerolineae bacterium]
MRLTRLMLVIGLLCAACTGEATPFELPTLAVLPSLTSAAPQTAADSTTPTLMTTSESSFVFTVAPAVMQGEATLTLPVPTEQLQVWYTTDVTAIYDCPELTCDILTNFPAGVQLLVIGTENGWHEILLARQRGRYVEARLTSQATPQPSTATAAATMLVGSGQGNVPPAFSPEQGAPPTIDLSALPPNAGTDEPRTTPVTATFVLTPPITLLPTIVSSPPFPTSARLQPPLGLRDRPSSQVSRQPPSSCLLRLHQRQGRRVPICRRGSAPICQRPRLTFRSRRVHKPQRGTKARLRCPLSAISRELLGWEL